MLFASPTRADDSDSDASSGVVPTVEGADASAGEEEREFTFTTSPSSRRGLRTTAIYFEMDYLFWDFEGTHLPPVLTANSTSTPLTDIGRIDAATTDIVIGGENVGDFGQSGLRFRFGRYLDASRFSRFEFSGWFLFDGSDSWRGASVDGDPILARPFYNTATGQPDAQVISLAGVADGSLRSDYRRRMFGFDPLLFVCLQDDGRRWVEGFFGYRYWRYEDSLDVYERVAPVPAGLIAPGTEFRIEDHFRAENDYHLVPLGVSVTHRGEEWRLETRGSVAVGFVRQEVTIYGRTEISVDGEPLATDQGGFLALASNSGRHERTRFAWVPQLEVVLRRQLRQSTWLQLGYSIFYLNDVVRGPQQIDTNIDPNLLPPALVNNSSGPAFGFRSEGELVHGLNAGILWKY